MKTLLALLLLIPSLSFSNDQKIYDQAYGLYLQNDNKGAKKLFLEIPNNIDAQYFLGEIYEEEKDLEKSQYWFEKCAENGDPYCQGILGYRYDNGIHVSENKIIALEFFNKSAEQGLSNSYTTIASYYLDGEVVNQSYSKAFEYYKLGAEAEFGDIERALYGLALMHEKGLGTKVDYEKAKELYLKAHHLGHEVALDRISAIEGDTYYALDLAEKYKTGSHISIGLPIDYEDSAFFFKIAEYKGSKITQILNDLYIMMEDGGYVREWKTAGKRFEIWKSKLGFTDSETIDDISEYSLNHVGTASYINSNILITNRHITHIDDLYTKKCDKLIGYDPYLGMYEEYQIFNSSYPPNKLDIDLINNPNKTKFTEIFINPDNLRLGESVVAIGFPQGQNLSKYPKVTAGIVTSDFGINNNPDEFLIDATSYGGSSGSPIFNKYGALIGVLWGGPDRALDYSSGAYLEDPNLGFVVKSSYIERFLELNNIPINKSDNKKVSDIADIVENNVSRIRFIECYKK